MQISVVGLLRDLTFHQAKCCAEDLFLRSPKHFSAPDIRGMLEFEWDLYIEEKKKEVGGEIWQFNDNTITFIDGQCIGNANEFLKLAESEYSYENFRPMPLYETLAEEAYIDHLNSKNRDYIYMDISIGTEPAGRLLIELFNDIVPKTCNNFRLLCTGENGESEHSEYRLHYKDSLIHRVVKNGWAQGGDIWMKKGDGGESVYGPVFEDENFGIKHTRRGIIGMANKGRHTNGSQFYMTLSAASWMDTQYVAFAQIIEGTETLAAIERVDTLNQRPLRDVIITDCGVKTFEYSTSPIMKDE